VMHGRRWVIHCRCRTYVDTQCVLHELLQVCQQPSEALAVVVGIWRIQVQLSYDRVQLLQVIGSLWGNGSCQRLWELVHDAVLSTS
jgi:hypothetical protein